MDVVNRQVREILLKIVSEDDSKIRTIREQEKIDFIKDLEFDSIMILEFIYLIEEKFGVSFEEEEDMVEIIWDYEKLIRWLEENV